jgi:hypothetical protein
LEIGDMFRRYDSFEDSDDHAVCLPKCVCSPNALAKLQANEINSERSELH